MHIDSPKVVLDPIICHRGASAYAPENTLCAFEKAYVMGSRWVEFDVVLSADGDAFVFHDTGLERTSNGFGEIGLMSSAYLKTLDAGAWFGDAFAGEPIPTLQTVLRWLNQRGMHANIELKPYPGKETETASEVSRLLSLEPQCIQVLISSFALQALAFYREKDPNMPLGVLFERWPKQGLALAHDLNACSIHLNQHRLTPQRVSTLKQQGFLVCAYTVNRRWQASRLYRMGVDAIFSNHPDLLG